MTQEDMRNEPRPGALFRERPFLFSLMYMNDTRTLIREIILTEIVNEHVAYHEYFGIKEPTH